MIDGSRQGATGQYILTTLDDNKVAQTYGAGWQSAATGPNIVALNEAAENGFYTYLFDRALELGNDTVLVQISMLKNQGEDLEALDEAAELLGYEKQDANGSFVLYHRNVEGNFGIVTEYDSICIGSSGTLMTYAYPDMQEGTSDNLSDYTYEDLKDYALIYLANFTYDDKETAENLVLQLAEHGCKVVIDGNGIPTDGKEDFQEFLGVSCQRITFENGYPVLYVDGQDVVCSLFPKGSETWNTVYFNGLEQETGYLYDNGVKVAFLGTAGNENISFIGLNLPYHYFMTGDTKGSGAIMDTLLGAVIEAVPTRELVPLEITYGADEIVITSGKDGVNTTLAYHDIFESEQEISTVKQLLFVNKGTTTIHMSYPYLRIGLIISVAALLCSILFALRLRKVYRKQG
jgi:uncharacterized membrane protein